MEGIFHKKIIKKLNTTIKIITLGGHIEQE